MSERSLDVHPMVGLYKKGKRKRTHIWGRPPLIPSRRLCHGECTSLSAINTTPNRVHTRMQRWQKKLIQTIRHSVLQLWMLRNKERHCWDAKSQESARQEVLHYELAEIYNRKNAYTRRVQTTRSTIQHTYSRNSNKNRRLVRYKGTFAVTWSPDWSTHL
jgi:hypothetical protein